MSFASSHGISAVPLLGVGGLVRAYAKSAAEAVTDAGLLLMAPGTLFELTVDYSHYRAIESFLRDAAQVQDLDFAQAVKIRMLVHNEQTEAFQKEILERTDGKCVPCAAGEAYLQIPE